jgi:hypothetical protein
MGRKLHQLKSRVVPQSRSIVVDQAREGIRPCVSDTDDLKLQATFSRGTSDQSPSKS